MSLRKYLAVFISILNFGIWYKLGAKRKCPDEQTIVVTMSTDASIITETDHTLKGNDRIKPQMTLTITDSKTLDDFRAEYYVSWPKNIFPQSFLINGYGQQQTCTSLSSIHVQNKGQCVAVVHFKNIDRAYNLLRYDATSVIHHKEREEVFKLPKSTILPIGFFLKVNRVRGRTRLRDKIMPLLNNYDTVMNLVRTKLNNNGHQKGADIVVMTLNDGELDLFLNYACSCKYHDISIHNHIVFSGSAEVIPLIESTGAMAVFHTGFSDVSRAASADYIDFIFVDMMWFKAMSLYVMIHLGYNVLFQDVDWVMFKNQMPLIHQKLEEFKKSDPDGNYPDILFSDDGNLSLRYAPFFANSGFYYIKANEKTEQLTWSIIESMDMIQRLGSHQNVLTMRMMELTDMVKLKSKIIPLDELPNGILYHHDRGFMKRMFNKEISPYGFHMCWTKGKPEKLQYLVKSKMWYLTPSCDLEHIIPPKGPVFLQFQNDQRPWEERFKTLTQTCCSAMEGAL